MALKARLKHLKKQVLDELDMGAMCTLRVYYYESYEASQQEDEQKPSDKDDPDSAVTKPQLARGDQLDGEMSTLSEMGLRHGGRVEVELVFGIKVSVAGKGSTYRSAIEVGPNEKMEVIRNRVPFFHIFSARNYEIVCPQRDNRVFEPEELNSLLFRDSNLSNGMELIMKEPSKKSGSRVRQQDEGDEEEQVENDDEVEYLDSDEEAIARIQREKEAEEGGAFGEGGEDELSEPEQEDELRSS